MWLLARLPTHHPTHHTPGKGEEGGAASWVVTLYVLWLCLFFQCRHSLHAHTAPAGFRGVLQSTAAQPKALRRRDRGTGMREGGCHSEQQAHRQPHHLRTCAVHALSHVWHRSTSIKVVLARHDHGIANSCQGHPTHTSYSPPNTPHTTLLAL
jgi:hypothetical protein